MRTIWIGLFSVIAAAAALPVGCGDTPETSGSGGATSSTSNTSNTSNTSSSSKTSSSSSSGMGGGSSSSGSSTSSSGMGGASSSSSSSASSTVSSSSSGVDGGALVNGCDAATAVDQTGMATATITFPGLAAFVYTPKCLKVKAGTKVTFNGNFSFHPLVAGEVVGVMKIPALPGTSPLPTNPGGLTMGMTAAFVMQQAGVYPYYCDLHATGGMNGAIFVVP